MANAIVVIAVIIIMLFAGKGAYKHLKGEGACCGGGSKPEIPKKKLDGTKLGEKTMKITGMHCENCVASVTRAINRIDGAAAKVSLKKGEAVVSYDREISNEELKKVVECISNQEGKKSWQMQLLSSLLSSLCCLPEKAHINI